MIGWIRIAALSTLALSFTCPALGIDRYTGNLSMMVEARALIRAAKYAEAIDVIQRIAVVRPLDADALSLLGYSLRKSGEYDRALEAYEMALELDPNHLGANEYLGELYVETGKPELAAEQLEMLEAICGTGCEEYVELQTLIAANP